MAAFFSFFSSRLYSTISIILQEEAKENPRSEGSAAVYPPADAAVCLYSPVRRREQYDPHAYAHEYAQKSHDLQCLKFRHLNNLFPELSSNNEARFSDAIVSQGPIIINKYPSCRKKSNVFVTL